MVGCAARSIKSRLSPNAENAKGEKQHVLGDKGTLGTDAQAMAMAMAARVWGVGGDGQR